MAPIGAAAVLTLSGIAQAQPFPQGPFGNVEDLIVVWQQVAPANAAYVSVDGQRVYHCGGFGPASGQLYFVCPQDALSGIHCPSEGTFQNAAAIIEYWRQAAPWVATTLSLEGALIEYRSGYGPALPRDYTTCYNRAGGGLMTHCTL